MLSYGSVLPSRRVEVLGCATPDPWFRFRSISVIGVSGCSPQPWVCHFHSPLEILELRLSGSSPPLRAPSCRFGFICHFLFHFLFLLLIVRTCDDLSVAGLPRSGELFTQTEGSVMLRRCRAYPVALIGSAKACLLLGLCALACKATSRAKHEATQRALTAVHKRAMQHAW